MPSTERATGLEKELEPKQKVTVHFEGLDHTAVNVQGIDAMRQNLIAIAHSTNGRTTIFLEAGGSTKINIDLAQRRIREFGGLVGGMIAGTYIAKNDVEPSVGFIQQRRELMSKLTLGENLQEGYITYSQIQSYHIFKMLDDLCVDTKLNLAFETHSSRVASLFKKDLTAFDLAWVNAFAEWKRGNFYRSLAVLTDYHSTEMRAVVPREAEIVNDIKIRSRRLLKVADGGAIFIVLGATHGEIIPLILKAVDPNQNRVKFSSTPNVQLEYSVECDKYVRRGENIPPLLLAKSMISSVAKNEAANSAYQNGKVENFCNEYVDVVTAINQVVDRMSLDLIRKTCESKVSVLQLFSRITQS